MSTKIIKNLIHATEISFNYHDCIPRNVVKLTSGQQTVPGEKAYGFNFRLLFESTFADARHE